MRVYGDVCGRCERKSQARERELSHRTSQGVTSLVTSESLCTTAPRCASTSLCLRSGTCGRLRRHVRYSTTSAKRACTVRPPSTIPTIANAANCTPNRVPGLLGHRRLALFPELTPFPEGPPGMHHANGSTASQSSPGQGRQAFSTMTTLSGRAHVAAGRQPYA